MLRVFNACDYINTIVDAQRSGPDGQVVRQAADALGELLHQG